MSTPPVVVVLCRAAAGVGAAPRRDEPEPAGRRRSTFAWGIPQVARPRSNRRCDVSNDAELSTDDLARSGTAQERTTAAEGERRFEPSSNVAAPGEGDEYAGATRMPDAVNAPMQEAGTAQMQEPGSAQWQDPGSAAMQGGGTAQMPDRGAVPGGRDGGMSPAPGNAGPGADMALLDPSDGQRFQQRWSDVQARFVDDPQGAVQTADGLVAEVMQSLARGFSDHKARLESAWQSGGDPDTEELRQALQRYRSFFNRLLST